MSVTTRPASHRPRYVAVWAALLALTVVTFLAARLELGPFDLPLALAIATVKAGLVVAFFMHLGEHARVNALVLAVAVLFVALLVGLSIADLVTRDPLARPQDLTRGAE